MPIDLAQPRVFAIEVGGRKYTQTVKPITKAMWLKYFAGIINTQEIVDGETSSVYDSTGARLELLEAALVDATGYTPEGTPISDTPDWQKKLPMAHRRAVADLLVAVTPVPAAKLTEDDFPSLGIEKVTLKATWTANEKGAMQEIVGLVHNFHSPSADHQKRYSRAMSRSIVTGGRTGLTRWLGAQDVLIDIYDELIESVDGYLLGGLKAAEAMDSYHKVAAASALFEPVQVAEA